MRSGFVAVVGRPNVGKSTLVNRMCGTKVSIVSDKVQTTRTQVRGVLTRPDAQIVFVDTPGILKPRTLLGTRTNEAATSSIGDVDLVMLVIDATEKLGTGDRWIADKVPKDAILVVNKIDVAPREEVLKQLARAGELGFSEYFPVSAETGYGVDALVDALVARLVDGPQFYPDDMVRDVPEAFWVAELVREQLLAVTEQSCRTRSPAGWSTGRSARAAVRMCASRSSSSASPRSRSSSGEAAACSRRSAPRCAPSSRRARTWSCSSRWPRTGSATPTCSTGSATEPRRADSAQARCSTTPGRSSVTSPARTTVRPLTQTSTMPFGGVSGSA